MKNSQNRSRRWFGAFRAVAVGVLSTVLLIETAKSDIVNCPTETSKTVVSASGGGFELGDNCYCTDIRPSSAAPGVHIMPDALTYRTHAEHALDLLHSQGAGASLSFLLPGTDPANPVNPINDLISALDSGASWSNRANATFDNWLSAVNYPGSENDLRLQRAVSFGTTSGQNSAINKVICYSVSQMEALHAASVANAQAVQDLIFFLNNP